MKVAGLQLDIAWENPQANYERIRPWAQAAAKAGARLLVLPEMFAHGFTMNTTEFHEPVDGPSSRFLQDLARDHGMWVCGSLPERPEGADRPYNTLVLSAPDGALTKYRKIHPFTCAGEHEHYREGADFVSVDIEGVRTTLFVCYDLRFADEFWANATQTDLYLVVANWPERRRHHWTTLLRARAIENQAYVAGVNRVGEGSGLNYAGDSQIIDPWGEILASAAGNETLLLSEVDPAVVADARRRFPFLTDRR